MGLFDDLIPQGDRAPVRITVNPAGQNPGAAEGYAATPRGYSTSDVQAAVRGDMFNSPGMPTKYAAQPGQTFGADATRNAQPFTGIVAHHTATPTLGGALNSQRDPFTGQTRGYHFLIDTDGSVTQSAPMDARTNHVQPPNSPQRIGRPDISNNNSVGIAFVGNSSNPTPEQLAAAKNLSTSLMDRHGIKAENVVGHGEIQASRQGGEGMPLVNSIREQPAQAAMASLSFDDLIPKNKPQGAFESRFAGAPSQYKPNGELAPALENRAVQLTQGLQTSPSANMAIDAGNQLSAASQGTTPHIDSYKGKLLSTEVLQDDAGNIQFRDPQTGKLVTTNSSQHVALRDPSDNTVKVYARDAATNESPVVGASRVLAPGLAAGAVTARAALGTAKTIATKASDIFSTAKPYYRAFGREASKIDIPPNAASKIVDYVKGAMEKTVPEHLAGEVYKSVEQISKGAPKELPFLQRVQAEMNGLPTTTDGVPIALDHLKDVKELIGQSFKSTDPRIRQAAGIASREIENVINAASKSAGSNLKTANDIQSTAHSLRQFDSMASRAGSMETRKLYRGNVNEKMREYLSKVVAKADDVLLKTPTASTKATTGFTNDEINAFREYVDARKALRYAAEASPTKGIMRTAMEAAAVAHSGPMALVIPALGYSANVLARSLDKAQIGRLREMIAKRSPAYAEAVKKSTDRFEKAQLEFSNKPTPNRLAGLVSASRALSSGLQKDGIQITSGNLIRSIAGPPKAAADSEQDQAPPVPGQ